MEVCVELSSDPDECRVDFEFNIIFRTLDITASKKLCGNDLFLGVVAFNACHCIVIVVLAHQGVAIPVIAQGVCVTLLSLR